MSKRKCKILTVTPDVAQRWLNECNVHNRPLRPNLVDKYAAAMKRGEWRLTAEPIAFCGPYNDECDEARGVTLINGQHRLWAVIESGVPCEMTVWWGCDSEEFNVIDQNAPRTLGDVLSTTRKDLSDPTHVASVCSTAAKFAFGLTTHSHGACGSTKLRPAQVQDMLRALEPAVVAVTDYKKRLRRTAQRPLVSALLLSQIVNPTQTALIVQQLVDAVGFTDKDPIRALHLYLTDLVSSTSKDTADVAHYKVCNAVAARLRGDHLRVLRVSGEGLGYLRDGARGSIDEVVKMLHGGRLPQNFYSPKLLLGV